MPRESEPLQKHFDYEIVESDEVLQDELDRIQLRRSRAASEKLLPEVAPTDSEAISASLTGLALSGGGIRSGAVGLGVLQGLYRGGLLPFFDYLSTVSGGGYAGAYLTSAASQSRSRTDSATARSSSTEDSIPYGRLKAFHDGEGQSERMQQFIFGGHYLLRTRRFLNRHLMGLLALWTITLSALTTLALGAAMLFRLLDESQSINFLAGLGLRTDISRGLFPVTVLMVLWGICWAVSFFRAAGNLAKAQGRSAAMLIPAIVGTFGVCLAALLGNGEFNLDWLSSKRGVDVSALFSSAEEFLKIVLYGVIGVGLLPFLNPMALIRSGSRPTSTSDRVVFSVASRVLLYGVPFLFVSWFARENLSEWTTYRFVPTEIHDVGVRAADVAAAKEQNGVDVRVDYVALTRREISDWGDWQPAWSPFWSQLQEATDRLARLETPLTDQPARLPHVAPFLWAELDMRVAASRVEIPSLPKFDGTLQRDTEVKEFDDVSDVLEFIHTESLALQSLYAHDSLGGDGYAVDTPRLLTYRLFSLMAYIPEKLQGVATQNYFDRFIRHRQRLSCVRSWLADHLSRILETTNLGVDCHWAFDEFKDIDTLKQVCERARQLNFRRNNPSDDHRALTTEQVLQRLSDAEHRDLARLNRAILSAAMPGTLREPSTVFAANVLEFDQARRWSMFKWSLAILLLSSVMININATSLHSFYARELANNWIETGEDTDVPLSSVDATDQSLPYHLISGSVHWTGKRQKPLGDQQRDHFLLSPMYCGSKTTGYVSTFRYNENKLGLGDAIAISGAAVSPVQQGNPLLQALLWLGNLRLGQWLPNPSHGTFLPTRPRNLVAAMPVTPWRVLTRLFQTAEQRPFVFVTDGGHHENLGIGPLLERRCRFMLAIDSGEDPNYSFSDLSRLMRWTRVKHNVRLQPVDSMISTEDDVTNQPPTDSADSPAPPADMMASLKSSIEAWDKLAPPNDRRLASDRLSSSHFVVLRVHYPDVDGPSWLIYAKTSLTGDEPAELIRYAESDKQFPHNPTANQFYAPDTFEAYRQLGEHIVESMIGQLPSIISGKLHEHRGRLEARYLGGLFKQICTARDALPLTINAAPPTPEAISLLQKLSEGDATADTQNRIARRLSIHPLMVTRLFDAALRSESRINSQLTSFLFPELAPESSPMRKIAKLYPLPGRAAAMKSFAPKDTFCPNDEMIETLLRFAEYMSTAHEKAAEEQALHLRREQFATEYRAVFTLLMRVRDYILDSTLRERVGELPRSSAGTESS